MNTKKSILVLFLIFVFVVNGQTSDRQLWLNAGIRKLINNKTRLNINFGTRFAENLTWRNYQFAQVGIQRKLVPKLSVAFSGRIYQSEELEYAKYKFRLMADLILKQKWNFLSVNYRSRYQFDRSLIYNYESALVPIHKWRNRIELTLSNSDRFTPDASVEVWYDFRSKYGTFNNLRLRSGLTYTLDKHHTYAIAFIYDKPLQRLNLYTNAYIINCSYRLTF